jgi:hypothetical protein
LKSTLRIFATLIMLAIIASTQSLKPVESTNPGFAKLQSLAGEWEGGAVHDGKPLPATTTFRLVSDGAAIMDDLAPGTPHEMITMFYVDGSDLLATHYCSHHNQPRLRALPVSDPNVLEFAFKDATNLKSPADPHMTALRITLIDSNHHLEEWTATANGQPVTLTFDFHRKP